MGAGTAGAGGEAHARGRVGEKRGSREIRKTEAEGRREERLDRLGRKLERERAEGAMKAAWAVDIAGEEGVPRGTDESGAVRPMATAVAASGERMAKQPTENGVTADRRSLGWASSEMTEERCSPRSTSLELGA